jgi:cathepsin L
MLMIFVIFIIFILFTTISFVKSDINVFTSWFDKYGNLSIYETKHYDEIKNSWHNNDLIIKLHNEKKLSWKLGHNKFSGMSKIEFIEYMKFNNNNKNTENNYIKYNIEKCELNNYIDWVYKGAVTNVKNQGKCGSCWAYSAVGSLEGIYKITYGKLLNFSQQQLIDCTYNINYHNSCKGGNHDFAFQWINQNNGLCLESQYKDTSYYTLEPGYCNAKCENVVGSKILYYVKINSKSESELLCALNKQPISASIDASENTFKFYKSGIITNDCNHNSNHAILVVGYGTINNINYYKIKNSWGTDWGENGYVYIARGDQYNDGYGMCGILYNPSYPVLYNVATSNNIITIETVANNTIITNKKTFTYLMVFFVTINLFVLWVLCKKLISYLHKTSSYKRINDYK